MKFGDRYKILKYNRKSGMVRIYDKKRKDTFSRPLKLISEAIRGMK